MTNIDNIKHAFLTGCFSITREESCEPRDFTGAKLGVSRTHVGGDLELYLIRDSKFGSGSPLYALVWAPRGKGRDFVRSLEMDRGYPAALVYQTGVHAVTRGRWVGRRSMLATLIKIFNNTCDRGTYLG